MNKYLKLLLIFALLLLCSLLFAWQQLAEKHQQTGGSVVIPQGASSHRVASLLEQRNIIDSAWLFRLAARLSGTATQIKAGEYAFSGDMSVRDVLNKLVAGDVKMHRLTIPEGLRSQEVLQLLADHSQIPLVRWQAALQLLLEGKEEEGRLLPETYTYNMPIHPTAILMSMIRAQTKILAAIKPESDEKIRIMASIIEKETSLDQERVLVSAAIHNRLRLGMPLQMDPTVIYGIWKRDGVFSGNIRRKDLKENTPWNTYTNKGLPPTAICNPGSASLYAAANPADVDYLYFVADGSGGHAFAATLAEHQSNVRKWVRFERKKRKSPNE
ncbi:MAG: endolytic transglycosylase MltG [Mariprofundaceae bacterium]|nr:endolytic transglycosylase MltG [Mariprofundaceae bacterium]